MRTFIVPVSGTAAVDEIKVGCRTPYDRPRPHKGAKPLALFASLGHRGASGGPRFRRLAAAAAAAAAAATTAAAAAATVAAATAAVGATAAGGTAAAATVTRCPRFPLSLTNFCLGFPIGSHAGITAAVGRPITGCPPALSAAPRGASRAYVRQDAGSTKRTPAVLCPLPTLALPSTSRYSGGDGGVMDIGVYQAFGGLCTRRGGSKPAPGWPAKRPAPVGTPSYGRTNPIPCASPG